MDPRNFNFSVRSQQGMNMFMIVFHYNGKWINSEYIGGQTKTMVIPNSITYAELVKRLYHRIDISPENFGMKVHYQYNSNLEGCNMMEIVDNEDVASWVFESLSIHPNKIPLYITVEHNLSMYASGSCEETTNRPNASLQYEDFVSTIPSSGLLEGQQPNTCSSLHESDNMQNTLEHQFNLDVNESPRDDY